MRPPNPWARLTPLRRAYRNHYAAYMASPSWFERRRVWHAEHLRRTGEEPVCVACGQPWTLNDDLHHRSYRRLGHEAHEDLLPLHRMPCHERLHDALHRSPTWRRMNHARATDHLIARMRLSAVQRRETPFRRQKASAQR